VEPGDLFVCIVGEKTDGHSHIPEALARGAVAVVVDIDREAGLTVPAGVALAAVPASRAAMAVVARRFYDDPSSRLTLAGVTGTNGKTTTALMLDSIFRAAGHESGLIGTIEYRIGDRRMKPLHTTPEAIDLQRLLAEMIMAGASHAAMEVSSHALALHRVDGCCFAAAIFTNLTPEHLDFHEDMEQYLQVKRQLFADAQYLPPGANRVDAINVDDVAGRTIAAGALGRTLTYGVSRGADCCAEQIELRADGSRFAINHPNGRTQLCLSLVGQFNVYNALAAFTAAVGLAIPPDVIAAGLEEMPLVRGRFERVPSEERTVLVDYAHTPDSLERALETARKLTTGRLIVVVGCGGDRDRSKRPVMGEIASRLADRCLVTSDNPRSETPEAIIAEIVGGIPPERRGNCSIEPDRAAAIRAAIQQSERDDVVLIAGKGHEDYQIFADRTVHFDDREAALEVLRDIEGGPDA
jgi:UDP-N-acetylmuramoyl-L-alanyl-D-glutamate--2,6-diaminopimelate ligase